MPACVLCLNRTDIRPTRSQGDAMTTPRPLTLEWLLAPLSIDQFSNEIWQRRACRVASGRPGYFHPLFGYRDFECVLEYGQPKAPRIQLASSRFSDQAEVPYGRG